MDKIIIIIFLFLGIIPLRALNMSVEDGLKFYCEHESEFKSIANQYNCDVREVAAIGLPEVERYLEWQNNLEHLALSQFYISGGKEKADFSIGYFQMKPSFIEALECEIVNDECLIENYFSILPQGNFSEQEQRKYRLEKLNDTYTQFEYLCVYYKIMKNKYPNDFKNKSESIKFMATAYNYGFQKPKENIIKWMSVKAFPYGRKFKFEQDAFSDVAHHIYQEIENSICMN